MSSQQLSSSPPSSSSLSEHKPTPPTQSKVHNLARRFSAMAKQNAQGNTTLSTPASTNAGPGKVSGLLNRYKGGEAKTATTATKEEPAPAKVEEKLTENEIETTLQATEPIADKAHEDVPEEPEHEDEEEEEEEKQPVAAALTEEPHSDLIDVPLTKADEEEEEHTPEEHHEPQQHNDDVKLEEEIKEKLSANDVQKLEQALEEVEITKGEENKDEETPAVDVSVPGSTDSTHSAVAEHMEDEQEPAAAAAAAAAAKASEKDDDKPAQTIEKEDHADQA